MDMKTDQATDVLSKLGGFEDPMLYLPEGSEISKDRGKEGTEADGIGEIIIATGVQVCLRAPWIMDPHSGSRGGPTSVCGGLQFTNFLCTIFCGLFSCVLVGEGCAQGQVSRARPAII